MVWACFRRFDVRIWSFLLDVPLGTVDKSANLADYRGDSGDVLICTHAEGIEWGWGSNS